MTKLVVSCFWCSEEVSERTKMWRSACSLVGGSIIDVAHCPCVPLSIRESCVESH